MLTVTVGGILTAYTKNQIDSVHRQCATGCYLEIQSRDEYKHTLGYDYRNVHCRTVHV